MTHPWERLYPPGLHWDTPIPRGAVTDLLDRAVRDYPERGAIEFRGDRITYAELGAEVDRLARGLAALGIERGDAVGLLLPNTPAHPVSFFAVLRLGARVVHLTPLDPARTVARKLADSGARTLITTNLQATLPQAAEVWRDGACDRLIVAEDREWGDPSGALPKPPGAINWAGLDGPPLAWPAIDPDEPALLQYTGGTTGLPRAAVLSHKNLTSAVAIYDAWFAGTGRRPLAGDRIMGVLPLFHIFALTTILLRGLVNGCEIMLRERFDAEAALDDIE